MGVWLSRRASVAVYRRDELNGGARLKTPCIVTEYSATTLIPENANVVVDQYGNLIIQLSDMLQQRH